MDRHEVATALVKEAKNEGYQEPEDVLFICFIGWLEEQQIDDGDANFTQIPFLFNCYELGVDIEL